MMMQALHEGGMGMILNPSLRAEEELNPAGIYEVGFLSYMSPKFLRLMPDGCLVKIMWDGIVNLPKGEWKIIFMERDEAEINASVERVDKYLGENGMASALNHKVTTTLPFCCYRTYNRDHIDHVLGIMDTRSDVELIPVQYQDVIDNPVKVFERLKYTPLGKERLPIDIEKAAAVINPDLHRIRA